jgi:pterin-4a-carbinolamine dehydratase
MQPFTFFISYRRLDTAPIALLLKNEIEKRLQFVRVFVDVESLDVGENFLSRINQAISEAQATIVLVGAKWMPLKSDANAGAAGPKVGSAAIDYVTHEIEASLTLPVQVSGREVGTRGEPPAPQRTVIPLFINIDRSFAPFRIPEQIRDLTRLNAERVDYASWPDAIGPLIEKLAVRLSLKERPDADRYPDKDPTKASTQPVSDEELLKILSFRDFDGWYLDNFGNSDIRYLVKTFRFDGFNAAAEFMSMVSNHCRILDHHPEWRNVFDHVTVSLTTWDARRQVTIYDLNLALFMNRAAEVVRKH